MGRRAGQLAPELLVVLEEVYPRLEDELARFIVSSLLGERLASHEALDAVERMMKPGSEPMGELLHAAEHVASDSPDAGLRNRAYSLLLQMKSHPSKRVRDWAEFSLSVVDHRLEAGGPRRG